MDQQYNVKLVNMYYNCAIYYSYYRRLRSYLFVFGTSKKNIN